MPLTSPRFAGNARLQQAANNSPTIRWGETGEAVKIIQQAYIDLGFPMPISTKKTGKPDGIFGNETYQVTRAFQKKHGLSADGIVGKNTMAKLDSLFPGTAPPRRTLPPRFEAVNKKDGFDGTASPAWLMVPLNGEKSVRVLNAHDLDIVSVSPGIATVHVYPEWFPQVGRTVRIKGIAKGRTFVEVRQGSRVLARLEVEVKTLKKVKITFQFMQDNAGHKTKRKPADVDDWVEKANEILLPQANVKLVKHNVRQNVKINKDLGEVVRFSSHLDGVPVSEHEWDDVTAKRDNTADLNVYFVWEYEQDETPNTDHTAAGTAGGNCIFEDNISRETHDTLAHEVGHHLGVDHSGDGLDLLMSPFRTDTRISKGHANTMNP